MIRYILYRVLWLVPTLLLVTMATFFLASGSQSQKVLAACADPAQPGTSPAYVRQCMENERRKQGLDKAPFFLSVHPLSEPDTLYLLFDPAEKKAARSLAWRYGSWSRIESFRKAAYQLLIVVAEQEKSPAFSANHQPLQTARGLVRGMLKQESPAILVNQMNRLEQEFNALQLATLPEWASLRLAWQDLEEHPERWRTWVPVMAWHGWDNQYTNWLAAVIFRLDLGKNDANRNVIQTIGALLPRTMLFTGLGILLAFLIAVPLALWSVRHAGQKREKALGLSLFMLDSVPSFWLAVMLLMIFADPEGLNWFSSTWEPDAPFWQSLGSMVLPLIAYTYGSLAFLTRTLRASLLEINQEPFVLTARSLGYSDRQILWRHTLRPALLPMITVVGTVFPALVSGSVILENLFGIHGLGYTILNSTLGGQRNVVLAVFTLSSLLTLVGYFVADLLYAWADPRIRFTANKQSG